MAQQYHFHVYGDLRGPYQEQALAPGDRDFYSP